MSIYWEARPDRTECRRHSAHITSSLARRLGGGSPSGPLLMGMERPVQIMPMDASVSQGSYCLSSHPCSAA
jgi:malate dehydrogenase (oxaloacetate-decarboxylating)(NADP+)